MKDLLIKIARANGEQWFGFIVLCLCFAATCTLVRIWTADHIIRCYYMKTEMTNAGIAYKIMGDVDWMEDIKSFTTPDADKAISVISNMKQCSAYEPQI